MKINNRKGLAAFTLIELMAVITIIIILAGLVVGGLGYVNERQNREKGKVQIASLSNALEQYKLEMGAYPATTNSETGLKAAAKNIAVTAPGDKTVSSLWKLLFKNGVDDNTTIYLAELSIKSKQGWIVAEGTPPKDSEPTDANILDPWGNAYRYRSAKNADGGVNSSTINPDFDLWTAGKDGKTDPATPGAKENKDDMKNF